MSMQDFVWAIRRNIVNWLWENQRDRLLDWKGLKNHIIHENDDFLDLFKQIYTEGKVLLSIREMYNIYSLLKEVLTVEGDIAEVGVYKGGSARMICAVKGNKPLHLFDTFEGMPEVNQAYDQYRKGDFGDTSLDAVKQYLDLSGAENVNYYKGIFPESAKGQEARLGLFAFVNLDVDLYQSTLQGLEFFYPRMRKGAILVSHDYNALSCPGVKQAFAEFFNDKPEKIIEVWDTQCFFIKMNES